MQSRSKIKNAPLFGLVVLAGLAGLATLLDWQPASADTHRESGPPGSGLSIAIGQLPRPVATVREGAADGDAAIDFGHLQAAMAGLDCSRLQLVEQPRTGSVELRGHVPAADLAADLVAASQRLAGEDARVIGNLLVLPPPLCGVLDSVEAMGLPQSGDQWNDPLAVGERAWADMPRAFDGQVAMFRFQAPDYDAHIYVDYFDSNGNVLHLMPSDFRTGNRFDAKSQFGIGDTVRDPRLFFSSPLGLDIALVIATNEPLYEGIRPATENARDYLSWLSNRVRARQAENLGFRGEWVFALILTEPG